jgi:hypothetical protein
VLVRWCASQYQHICKGRPLFHLFSRIQRARPAVLGPSLSALWLRLAQLSCAAADPHAPFDHGRWQQQLQQLDRLEAEEAAALEQDGWAASALGRAALAATLEPYCAFLDGLLLLLIYLRDSRSMCVQVPFLLSFSPCVMRWGGWGVVVDTGRRKSVLAKCKEWGALLGERLFHMRLLVFFLRQPQPAPLKLGQACQLAQQGMAAGLVQLVPQPEHPEGMDDQEHQHGSQGAMALGCAVDELLFVRFEQVLTCTGLTADQLYDHVSVHTP